MTNYTMGSAYDRSRFDVNKEIVPANLFLRRAITKCWFMRKERKIVPSFTLPGHLNKASLLCWIKRSSVL